MVKKIIAAVVLIALLTFAIVQAMNKETPTGLNIGSKAPDFELKTLTGEKVKLSSLKGKKVMLNFWATWCPPCKAEMPEMEEFSKQMDKDQIILAVNIDPQNDVLGFANKNGITFPILLDENDQVNGLYQITSIPTTYFIDKSGIIQNKVSGGMKFDEMKKLTSEIK